MHRISLSRFRLGVLGAVLLTVPACGDTTGLFPAQFPNVVDTVTLYALHDTPIASPSGFDIVNARRSRIDLGEEFDIAFDIDSDSVARVIPSDLLGVINGVGLLPLDASFDSIARAPLEGFVSDSTLAIDLGATFVARSRLDSEFCLLSALPRYAKFHVLGLDSAERSATFEILINLNCGYRSLEPGLPES